MPDRLTSTGMSEDLPEARDLKPALLRDHSFWGMTCTQFLGAFNDNLFKQLLLLLAVVAAVAGENGEQDLQGRAMIVFATPFLLFSGVAGYLSDLFSKRQVIVLSKVAEIVVMSLGLLAFLSYTRFGLHGMFVVLFLMGAQSAFFGPSKYGILPETLRPVDLPHANGIILMTTFLAIILGTAIAGVLKVAFPDTDQLWMVSAICVLIACLGTGTSLLIRKVPAAEPGLKFQPSSLTLPPETRRLLSTDKPLLSALLASCMFWLVGGLVQMSVNALGMLQLKLDARATSLMVSSMAIGIAIGCILAGILSRGRFASGVVRTGIWGIFACLVLLSLPGGVHGQWIGFWGSIPTLLLLGMFAGMFAVPLQVFLQSRPPESQKGRMIATMNLANWIAILSSGIIYWGAGVLLEKIAWQPNAMFALTAGIITPVALWYRPVAQGL